MKNMIYISLAVLLAVSCEKQDAGDTGKDTGIEVTVCTSNVWSETSRASKLKSGTTDPAYYGNEARTKEPQHLWNHCHTAYRAMLDDIKADIYCFQEITDTLMGLKKYADGVERDLPSMLGDKYIFVAPKNTDPAHKNTYSSANVIAYRAGKFILKDSGVFWTGSKCPNYNLSPINGMSKYSSCSWARLRHRDSGKEFLVITAHPVLPSSTTPSRFGTETEFKGIFTYSLDSLRIADSPSLLLGDFNIVPTDALYAQYIDSGNYVWKDSRITAIGGDEDAAVAAGRISRDDITYPGTQPNLWTEELRSDTHQNRFDYVFHTPDIGIVHYAVNRKKYVTANGTSHYPSDHFQVVVKVKI